MKKTMDVKTLFRCVTVLSVMLVNFLAAEPCTGYSGIDIGSVGIAGSVSFSNNQYTVTGSGSDIYGQADSFYYVYWSLTGDGSVTARVNSLTNTQEWAKAGVMIRETLEAASAEAAFVLTPEHGISFQSRASTGASTSWMTTTGAAPYWVKLERIGDIFRSSKSTDGISWTFVSEATLSMTQNLYIGLCVTAHDNTLLNTAVFDNVSFTGGVVTDESQVATVKMVSYNIQQSKNVSLFSNLIQQSGAGIVGLTESFGNSATANDDFATALGPEWTALYGGKDTPGYAVPPGEDAYWWIGGHYMPAGLLTKYQIIEYRYFNTINAPSDYPNAGLPIYRGATFAKLLVTENVHIGVMVLHLNPWIEHELRLNEITALAEELNPYGDLPLFIIGDFNTLSHLDGNSDVYVTPYLASQGYIDSYRTVHPDPVSHPGITNEDGRIDYIFYKNDITPIESFVVEDGIWGSNGYNDSDHLALFGSYQVTGNLQPYCESAGNTADEYIGEVQIGTFINASTDQADYTDFTSRIINVEKNGTYSVSLTEGGGAWNEYWTIWIDFNLDQDFLDDGETFFIGSGTSIVTGQITIPDSAIAADTRLRISMKYNGEATSCETFGYGEVEDYTLRISEATTAGEAPVAYGQTARLEADSRLPIRLSGKDPEGALLTFDIVTAPTYGLLLGTSPDLVYVPNDLTVVNNDAFTFRVSDGTQWSNTSSVTIEARNNSVSSDQIQGISSGLYLHIPNQLVYRDIGPNNFNVTLNRTEDLLDSHISRVDFNGKSLAVDTGSQTLQVPYTVSIKWIPDLSGSNGTLLQTSAFTLSENSGFVETNIADAGTSFNNATATTTGACNHIAVVVTATQVITYVNGVPVSSSVPSVNDLSGSLLLENYPGRIWDLRVYDHAMTQSEIDESAEDCTDTLVRQDPFDGIYASYICGPYMCMWYNDGDYDVTQEQRESFLRDQDFFYEYNLFTVGMHAYGNLGDYFLKGRDGNWNGKERDWEIDDRWSKFAKVDGNRLDNSYWTHEDFHQYQSPLTGYLGSGYDKFFVEATAEWASDDYSPGVILDLIGMYTLDPHLPFWASNGSSNPMQNYQTINGMGEDNGGHQYGAFIFMSYLTKNISNPKLIGDAYNHELRSSAPVQAMYELLQDTGVDMAESFIDFAARSVTWDMPLGDQYTLSEQASINRLSDLNVTVDTKFTAIYSDPGTGDVWTNLPTGYNPGGWGYNLFRVEDIATAGNYTISFNPSSSNPEFAEFKGSIVVYNEASSQRSYYTMDLSDTTTSSSVDVNVNSGDLIYLVIACTPSTKFTGYEQVDYQYKIYRN